MENKTITVQAEINVPIEKVWQLFTKPEHIIKWNFASNDWHCPSADNDLRVGGKFRSRMESKDGSSGFDFSGNYIKVNKNELIEYTIEDNRKVSVQFESLNEKTRVTETFEAESQNPEEMQRDGWQSILNNFKRHVEREMQKNKDEQAIRNLINTWISASKEGDTDTVLSLMADDVVFLVPGHDPFGKEEFREFSSSEINGSKIEGTADIKEIKILEDWAYARAYLEIVITTPASSIKKSGYTLTIFHKESNGNWKLIRDANLLMEKKNE